jgi:pimeloyl-ACP methyl ester carboxylesterase
MPFVTVTPNSRKLHYLDTSTTEPQRGNGETPIVMIHGLGSSQNYYMPIIRRLQNYRCIALDSYGAGRSKSDGEKLSLESMSEDVIGLMDELSIAKAVIVGHSMGGLMVLTIAAAHPDRVVRVVAIGPVSPKHVNAEAFTQRIETVMKGALSCRR